MRRIEIWVVLALFTFGVVAGMNYLDTTSQTTQIDSDKTASPPPSQVDSKIDSSLPKPNSNTAELGQKKVLAGQQPDPALTDQRIPNESLTVSPLQKGDTYLVAGNYTLALDYYARSTKSTDKAPEKAESTLLLREAICFEKQRNFDRAARRYYGSIIGSSNQTHQLIATAGYARCLLEQGQHQEALNALSKLVLTSDQHPDIPKDVIAQVVYQHAKTLESIAMPTRPDLVNPMGVAFSDYQIEPQLFLAQVDFADRGSIYRENKTTANAQSDSAFSNGHIAPGISILQRPAKSLNVISARISFNLEPVLKLVSEITAAANMDLVISQNATSALQNRARAIEIKARPLSVVLDQLLAPFDLVWFQVDMELHLVSQSELTGKFSQGQYWLDAALRGMRQFELSFPGNQRRHSAMLSRGNINMLQNRLDTASNLYQALAQSQPRDEILAKLFFNEGKLHFLRGNSKEASRLLYLATDQSLDPNIQSSGYCLLGKIQLSSGILDSSIQSSRRGLSMATSDHQKQYTTLNLVRAYLLQGDPFSANNILFQQQKTILDADSKAMASVLGAFARLNGTKDNFGIRIARNRLLRSATAIQDDQYHSFADCYIAASSFKQLGFKDRAIEKLSLALSMPDIGQWQRQLTYELAVLQKQTGRKQESTKTLELLTAANDNWTTLALVELARNYSESNQNELCIQTCRQLWQSELDETQKRYALELLGSAFQNKGEHHSAAICFAGMLPKSF